MTDFESFWPYYVAQHRNPTCRKLHFAGTSLGLTGVVLGLVVSPWFFAAAPIVGYGLAWVGHYVFEKNKPATFGHPAWSLRGDLRMMRLIALGQMTAEAARLTGKIPHTLPRKISPNE
jgi:hypothetical protein